jgi:serpin B
MMRRRELLKTALVAGVGGLPSTAQAAFAPSPAALSAAKNAFGLALLRAQDATKNAFLSPTSVSAALGMTACGAQGETRAQMAKVLGFSAGDPSVDPVWAELVKSLRADKPGRQVSLANRLFGQKGYGFLASFTGRLSSAFDAPLEEIDFGVPEAAKVRINAWVASQTRDMIKDLIPSGVITPMTRLVLANAIHFKGEWLHPFTKSRTVDQPFEIAPGNSKALPMMSQTGQFAVREDEEAVSLTMPCKGDDRCVVFILPRKRHNLAQVESSLTAESLDRLVSSQAVPQKVDLRVPRFEVDTRFGLNESLKKMGMARAFESGRAEFEPMNGGKEPLHIDAVLHKAVLKVDEQGAEAAAATGVIVATRAAIPQPVRRFVVDQPFLVAIHDKATGGLLFLGRVREPASKA